MTKTWKKPLRTLSLTQLQSVAGGFVIDGSGDTVALSNPEDTTSLAGGGPRVVPSGIRDGAIIFWTNP